MTTHPLTHQSLFDNSWLSKTLQWFPTPALFAWRGPLQFFPIPQDEITAEKSVVVTRLRRSTQNRKTLSTHSHLRTSRDAWNHGKQTGILYICTRELLRRRRWKLGETVRIFLWFKFPEFWGSTSYFQWFFFHRKSYRVWDKVEKYGTAEQQEALDDNILLSAVL